MSRSLNWIWLTGLLLPAIVHSETVATSPVTTTTPVTTQQTTPASQTPCEPTSKPHHRRSAQERITDADNDRNGKISREEAQSNLPKLADDFDLSDADKDGSLTPEEIREGQHKKRTEQLFRKMDTDNNGQISLEEFRTYRESQHRRYSKKQP